MERSTHANADMRKRNQRASASSALVVLAALCWGISGGIGGILLARGWDPLVVSFSRGMIGLLFVLAWLALRPAGNGLKRPRLWLWSAIAGCGVAGNFSFYFMSISQGSVAVAATLMYCAPVFVYFASFVLKLERLTPLKTVAIVLVLLGIVLLTQIYATGADVITPLGIGAGLLAGLSYAIFIFGFTYASPYGSPQAILSIAFAALVLVVIWPADLHQIAAVPTTPDWPLFAGLGVLGAGVSFALYITGLKHTTPAAASIVAMIEPVAASLFGIMFLDEKLAGPQILGMGLILVTVTAMSVSAHPRRPQSGLPQAD